MTLSSTTVLGEVLTGNTVEHDTILDVRELEEREEFDDIHENIKLMEARITDANSTAEERDKKQCIRKELALASVRKVPVLSCSTRGTQECFSSFSTRFDPVRTELCLESFQKSCRIRFQARPVNITVQECQVSGGRRRRCGGCRTSYEPRCRREWVERVPGDFVQSSMCEQVPTKLCMPECEEEEEEKECREKIVTTGVEVQEVCTMHPVKRCREATKLLPRLEPTQECTVLPAQKCELKFSKPGISQAVLVTKWCREETQNNSEPESLFYLEEMFIT